MSVLSAVAPGLAPAGQSVPCGPDCIHARPQAHDSGDWIWCTHPAAQERLRLAGRECRRFRPPGSLSADAGPVPGFSHGI